MTRVDPPEWARQPKPELDAVTTVEYATIQQHRREMLEAVQHEIETYVNDPLLCNDSVGMFPQPRSLAGTYYVSRESYSAHRDPTWFQISIQCHCIEALEPGDQRQRDYLGLEVWFKVIPDKWSSFETLGVDSSSI
jgi:hypothetical protein